MYLLIDECCRKSLVAAARSAGHVAQRSVEVAKLGRGAPDTDIFAFAWANGAVIVTINQGDFLKLARRTFERPGIIVLPSARGSVLARVFATALPGAVVVFETHPNAIVQIDAAGRIADIAIE